MREIKTELSIEVKQSVFGITLVIISYCSYDLNTQRNMNLYLLMENTYSKRKEIPSAEISKFLIFIELREFRVFRLDLKYIWAKFE